MKLFLLLISTLTFASAAFGQDHQSPFAVQDIPAPKPIEGQLGEPGAPSLKDQQESLAKALLSRGICNESFYGEAFCTKQKGRSFKVTDQLSSSASEHTVTPESKDKL